MAFSVDKYKRNKNTIKPMAQNKIRLLFSIIGVPIFMALAQNVGAGDHKNRLSIIPLENPAGWAAPYNPGKMIAEMLKQSISSQGRFHLSSPPRPPRSQQSGKKSTGIKMHPKKTQLNHPIQFILGGKVLHFTPGKPPSRAQIILNIGDALKQRAEMEVELELTSHHMGKLIAKEKFQISSIAGTVPFDLDASKVDFYSPKFQNSSIGKAMLDLNQRTSAFLMTTLDPLPLEAEVISVAADQKEVIINAGQLDGVGFGDSFNVYSVTLQYKDPFTEMDLGSGFIRRGVIRVKNVQEGYSIAEIIAGEGFEMGELARARKTNPVHLDRNLSAQNTHRPLWETPENNPEEE